VVSGSYWAQSFIAVEALSKLMNSHDFAGYVRFFSPAFDVIMILTYYHY
jgi:hypothetical protein